MYIHRPVNHIHNWDFCYIFSKQIVVQNAVVSEFGVNNIKTSSSITKMKWRFCRDASYAVFKTAERRVVSDQNI